MMDNLKLLSFLVSFILESSTCIHTASSTKYTPVRCCTSFLYTAYLHTIHPVPGLVVKGLLRHPAALFVVLEAGKCIFRHRPFFDIAVLRSCVWESKTHRQKHQVERNATGWRQNGEIKHTIRIIQGVALRVPYGKPLGEGWLTAWTHKFLKL